MNKKFLGKKPLFLTMLLLIICMFSGCGTLFNMILDDDNYATESTIEADELDEEIEDAKEPESVTVEEDMTENMEEDMPEPVVSETEEEESDITESDENVEEYDFNSVEAITEICGLEATVETNIKYGVVNTFNDPNPYDVEWDYGEEYDAYVDACDWSLVFDADYYMETFPMLARQYHYDGNLLLIHFQTVGIHEGRQGSADFNVSAYAFNTDAGLYDAFGSNYEGYYIYYMLNYDSEKNVDTVNNADGTPTVVQYKQIFTAMQLGELEEVNAYRAELGVEPLTLDSEMCAAANLRAYINAHDGYAAHDWARENTNTIYEWIDILGADTFSENTVTSYSLLSSARTFADDYAKSEAHYNAMTDDRFVYTGMSNCYVGSVKTSQFDVFVGTLDTPMHH